MESRKLCIFILSVMLILIGAGCFSSEEKKGSGTAVPAFVRDNRLGDGVDRVVGRFGTFSFSACDNESRGQYCPQCNKCDFGVKRDEVVGGSVTHAVLVGDGKVAAFVNQYADNSRRMDGQVFPRVKSLFEGGIPKPKYLAKPEGDKNTDGYNGVTVIGTWMFDGGMARINAICGRVKSGDKLILQNFGECSVFRTDALLCSPKDCETKIPDTVRKVEHEL